jgi:endonuclease V-like protein UPF0215 family
MKSLMQRLKKEFPNKHKRRQIIKALKKNEEMEKKSYEIAEYLRQTLHQGV